MAPAAPELHIDDEEPGELLDLFSLTLDSFVPRSLDTAWPSFSGLYCLLNGAGDPIYIGQSVSVRSRLLTHRREKKWWPDVDQILTFSLASELDSRLIAETGLILRHRPRHNKAIKIGIANDGHLFELQFLRGKR